MKNSNDFVPASAEEIVGRGLLNGISLVRGTLAQYGQMINDERVDEDTREKLKELRDNDLSIISDVFKKQIDKEIDNLDSLSEKDKEKSLNEIRRSIDCISIYLKDPQYAEEMNKRLSSLDEKTEDKKKIVEDKKEIGEDKKDLDNENKVTISKEKSNKFEPERIDDSKNNKVNDINEVDFNTMSNNELFQFLYDLEDKIKKAAYNRGDALDSEIHRLLGIAAKAQVEIDKRIDNLRGVNKQNSLEAELDDFAKEQDKVKNAKHFTEEDKDVILEEMEQQSNNSRRRR